MSDGVELLRSRVASYGRGGQTRAAEELGISKGAVSDLLSGSYKGNVQKMSDLIIERYYPPCPVLGKITGDQCAAERGKKFSEVINVDLYRSCRQCEREGKV